jgi:hypothetical protein
MLTIYFSVAGLTGWMQPDEAGAATLGCSIAMGLVYWVGPTRFARTTSGVQLVPWLPPTTSAVAHEPSAADGVVEEDPDPASVPTYYRVAWNTTRWVFIVAFAPLWLPFWAIRKTLDRIA